jgi:hypothetical protein
MLLAILIGGAILALALGLNPLTFQKFGAEPEATPAALATPVVAANTPAAGATVAPAGAAAPAVAPTTIPTPVAAAPQAVQTAAPAATPVARAEQPETAATTTAAEPQVQGAEPTAVSNEQAEPTPVQAAVPAELAAAIIQGYDNYWSVRVRAMADPSDSSIDLESVMAGDELQTAYKTLADYRDAGEAFQTTVHHSIWITRATSDDAAVMDWFSGESIKIDPGTGQPVSSNQITEKFSSTFLLKNIDGTWKVVGQSQEQ